MYFNKSPFLRLSFPFILGIVSYHYLESVLKIHWSWPLILFLLFLLLAKRGSLRFNSALSIIAMVILFMFGFLRLKDHRLDSEASHLLWLKETVRAYEGVVLEEPSMKAKSINLRVGLNRVLLDSGWQEASGKINVYVHKEKGSVVNYGDRLLIRGTPQHTIAPANPGEFDFANYLVYNNTFHQQFVGDDFVILGKSIPNVLMSWSIELRKQCRDRLSRHITDPEVRSVMLAIVLGIKDELDSELQGAFSASGAMHVLAVSGLHVGIIYAIVLLIFKLLKVDAYKRRWTIAIISILTLWCYAFLTGLSPSVLRAVTMFSFVALSKAMNRNSNIYNTLAASAFVLLWYNPYLIMSVGFQLSYMAVFGIVYLQPKFYRLITVNNYWLDKVWAITCVSLAAQIATAPLSMLYFHQFPSYFLISNLFIIPAAFAMLLLGLGMLLLSAVPFIGEALGWLIEFFVNIVNQLVFWVRDLPGSTLEGIRISTGETWLVYAVIICLMLLFYKKRFVYLLAACIVAGIFTLSQIDVRASYMKSGTFRVLNVSRASVADFRYGRDSRLLADSTFTCDPGKRRFHFEPGRLLSGSNLRPEQDALALVKSEFMGNPLVCFKGESFLFLQNSLDQLVTKDKPLCIDHLVVSHNAVRDLKKIQNKLTFKSLLIDTSNKGYVAESLVNQAKALDLRVHSVQQDGFFEKLWQE